MSICNFSASLKQTRSGDINTAAGVNATMKIYSGSPPVSPDISATGTLLATLACASGGFGAVAEGVGAVGITNPGSNFTAGTYALAFSGGTGSGAAGTYTVAQGGTISSAAITAPGSYSAAPSVSFPNGGGAGATGNVAMTGVLTAGTITAGTAVNSGNAGYARISNSSGSGVIDLDVGTANASAIINTTSIVAGGAISCTSCIIVEG